MRSRCCSRFRTDLLNKPEQFEFFGAMDGIRRLDDASVLVTGATGSFGQLFVRTLLARGRPKRLIVFSRDELKQFEMTVAGLNPQDHSALRYFIGDVRDRGRLEMAMRDV